MMKFNAKKNLGLLILFAFSFVFFFYLTFPYGVLKEVVVNKFNANSDIKIQVGELDPSFPVGIELESVKLISRSGKSLQIDEVEIDLSLLRLLIGSLAFDLSLYSKSGGSFGLFVNLNLLRLIQEQNALPSSIAFDAKKYPIDGMLSFALSILSSSPTMNPAFAPMMQQIALRGQLDGSVDLDLDVRDPTQSRGDVRLGLKKGALIIDDPSLNIAEQQFSKFLVKAGMKKGQLVLDKSSGIESQELKIGLNGKIDIKEKLENSLIDLDLKVKLDKGLKDLFGFAVEMAMGGRNGEANVQLKGSLLNPRTINL